MPTPDQIRPRRRASLYNMIATHLAYTRRPRRKPGDEPEFGLVEPNRPKNLSGGAAAELEYDS